MKKFRISLREFAADVINFGKKKILTLTEKELKLHQDLTQCFICRNKFAQKLSKDKNHRKVTDHCDLFGKYSGPAHSVCSLIFNVPNEILVIFHKGSRYDYYFIMKKLANEFQSKFECLEKKIKKSTKLFQFQ